MTKDSKDSDSHDLKLKDNDNDSDSHDLMLVIFALIGAVSEVHCKDKGFRAKSRDFMRGWVYRGQHSGGKFAG